MRLIDADKLKKHFAWWHEGGEEADRQAEIFEQIIDVQPTVEERKRGKWIETPEDYYKAVNARGGGVNADTPFFTEDDVACPECLTIFSVIDNCTELFDYCPNCGADMRGDENGTD